MLCKEQLVQKKGKKQPLYELTRNEIERYSKNNVHLTHFSRKWNKGKCDGVFDTNYQVGKIGDNIIKAYYRQSKPNSCT